MTTPKPIGMALADTLIVPLWWLFRPARLRERPWTAGFNPEVDKARLASIRWRADRGWTAWHIHDVRFLIGAINDLATTLDLVLVDVAKHKARAEQLLDTVGVGSR